MVVDKKRIIAYNKARGKAMTDLEKDDGCMFRFVENTPEICMVAVKQNRWALRIVENQTPEICMVAVKQNG